MSELKTTEAIPQTELQRLVRLQAEVKEANGERAGDYGDEVKAASDKYGVNKKALSMVCTLNRMTREKRDDVLRSFDNYTLMMGWEVEDDLVDRMKTGQNRPGRHSLPCPEARLFTRSSQR